MRDARILVTGAAGFVGHHLCKRLVDDGATVVGLVRRFPADPVSRVNYVVGDLASPVTLRQAAEGVSHVVHLAARVHVMRDHDPDPHAAFRRVNVEGTSYLLDAVLAREGTVVVYVSSVKADGLDGERDPYGATKRAAELLVLERCTRRNSRGAVLRLPLVYGAGMRGNMLRLFETIDRGTPLPFGAVSNQRSLVYVGNAVEALCRILWCEQAQSTYNVRDATDVSTPELIRAVSVALDRPARLFSVPPAAFRLVGRVGDLLASILPVPMPFTSRECDRLLGSLSVDNAALCRDTGFAPPVAMTEGLQQTAAWFRSRATERTV